MTHDDDTSSIITLEMRLLAAVAGNRLTILEALYYA